MRFASNHSRPLQKKSIQYERVAHLRVVLLALAIPGSRSKSQAGVHLRSTGLASHLRAFHSTSDMPQYTSHAVANMVDERGAGACLLRRQRGGEVNVQAERDRHESATSNSIRRLASPCNPLSFSPMHDIPTHQMLS